MTIQKNVVLAPFTTLKVGGPAKYFSETSTIDELKEAIGFANAHQLPIFYLGGGSNVIISDKGWDGLVIKIGIFGNEIITETETELSVSVGAGENWDDFVAWSVSQNLSGIECLSGIPGTVGSTPIQNVGAYGQEVAETIQKVEILDTETGKTRWISNSECQFSYRNSVFKQRVLGNVVVVSVEFKLVKNQFPTLRYGELKREVEAENITDIKSLRDKVLEIRTRKSMVARESDVNSRSAGSFFTNPIVSKSEFEKFTNRAIARDISVESIPNYPQTDGTIKLAAGWLVENSGFKKGSTFGRVGLSQKHALAIVNLGEGRAHEVLDFSRTIQLGVKKMWGVDLENEPQFIGEFD